MKTWSYSINAQCGKGTIELVERPWYIAFVEWFANWIAWGWLYKINLPNWPTIQWTSDDDDKLTPHEWLGTYGDAVFCYVTSPLLQWVWHLPRNKHIHAHVGYDEVKKLFYSDSPEFFDEHEKRFTVDT